jgi:hypothetical protein
MRTILRQPKGFLACAVDRVVVMMPRAITARVEGCSFEELVRRLKPQKHWGEACILELSGGPVAAFSLRASGDFISQTPTRASQLDRLRMLLPA